jgi:hypothetical protein
MKGNEMGTDEALVRLVASQAARIEELQAKIASLETPAPTKTASEPVAKARRRRWTLASKVRASQAWTTERRKARSLAAKAWWALERQTRPGARPNGSLL